MAVHPQCPCTRASLGELDRILARASTPPSCRFLVYVPAQAPADWTETELVRRLGTISCARIEEDRDGRRAEELGILTSGGVVLADQSGTARFYGGITAARNHEGDNAGKAAILMLLDGKIPSIRCTPTYGCLLK